MCLITIVMKKATSFRSAKLDQECASFLVMCIIAKYMCLMTIVMKKVSSFRPAGRSRACTVDQYLLLYGKGDKLTSAATYNSFPENKKKCLYQMTLFP